MKKKLLAFILSAAAASTTLQADITNEHIDDFFDIWIHEARRVSDSSPFVSDEQYTHLANADHDDGYPWVDGYSDDAGLDDDNMIPLKVLLNPSSPQPDAAGLKITVSNPLIKFYDENGIEIELGINGLNDTGIVMNTPGGPLEYLFTSDWGWIYVDCAQATGGWVWIEFVMFYGPDWHAFKRIRLSFTSGMDGDSLDDYWEWEFFRSFAYNEYDDADGDGYTNIEEYIQDSDPSTFDHYHYVFINN